VLFHFTWFMWCKWKRIVNWWWWMLMNLMWAMIVECMGMILDNAMLLSCWNVKGGVLLHCFDSCYVGVVHYRVIAICPCIISCCCCCWNVKGGVLLHSKRRCTLTWMFLLHPLLLIWYHMHICVKSRRIA
jgi:hypothetical protein